MVLQRLPRLEGFLGLTVFLGECSDFQFLLLLASAGIGGEASVAPSSQAVELSWAFLSLWGHAQFVLVWSLGSCVELTRDTGAQLVFWGIIWPLIADGPGHLFCSQSPCLPWPLPTASAGPLVFFAPCEGTHEPLNPQLIIGNKQCFRGVMYLHVSSVHASPTAMLDVALHAMGVSPRGLQPPLPLPEQAGHEPDAV